MHGCKKCAGIAGLLFLLVGIAFLLVDIGTWEFFGLSWYTVVFLIMGLKICGMAHCKECQETTAKK